VAEDSPDMDLCVCVCGQLENPLRWYCLHGWKRRRRLIEGDAKSLRLHSDMEKDFDAGVYLFEAHSPPRDLSWGVKILQYRQTAIVRHPFSENSGFF
jgi:hypothetical protein